ncbi:MAG TPA: VWA domain-containing protein, partial [Pseudonocardia sp.]|nr:VWA domain-containing protein [Pseudonocardia sp.]
MSTSTFPFSAVVGHDDLRLALLLNAVHPGVGGVLVRGEKGTAKSTAVRALAALLPALDVVVGCRFSCDPAAPDPQCPDGPHAGGRHRRAARLVELPVGATEDRLVGSLDLERALAEGVRAYQPGLLAEAHRGVLYVDEVNLLHDHLVDALLDAAAMGRAHVERDGVSVSHAARFLLVGTMNPEEGELRPQLLDRFGLAVEVRAARDVATRAEVVRRRLAFDDDPSAFTATWAPAEQETAARIAEAQARVGAVALPDAELRRIAAVCAAFDVDGMRADLVIARAATAHAAWRGASAVAEEDVRVAARLALPHRRRRDPFDEAGVDEQALDDAMEQARKEAETDPDDPDGGGRGGDADGDNAEGDEQGDGAADRDSGPGRRRDDSRDRGPGSPDRRPNSRDRGWSRRDDGPDGRDSGQDGRDDGPDGRRAGRDGGPDGRGGGPDGRDGGPDGRGGSGGGAGRDNGGATGPGEPAGVTPPGRAAPPPGPTFRARRLVVPGVGEGAPGRRSRARTELGRVVRASATPARRAADIHLQATVLAAAPHQHVRGRESRLLVHPADVRHAVREGREGNLVLFAVDASGSMAAKARMTAVTGAVVSLLRDAYQRRDKVGLITFRGTDAELVLPPTSSVPAARVRLSDLRTGGRTPLARGLLRARKVLAVERL